jgi:ABC-type uncharacterized transport system permease subunit
VLSFGAFALAAVSGSMFLLLDHLLHGKKLSGGLFNNLPTVHDLMDCTRRLMLIGVVILTIGMVAGFFAPSFDFNTHFLVALFVWVSYAAAVVLGYVRGLPPHRLSILSIVLFLIALIAFGLI